MVSIMGIIAKNNQEEKIFLIKGVEIMKVKLIKMNILLMSGLLLGTH